MVISAVNDDFMGHAAVKSVRPIGAEPGSERRSCRWMTMVPLRASSVRSKRAYDGDVEQSPAPKANRNVGALFKLVLQGTGGEGITDDIRMDAMKVLTKLPDGVPMPAVALGEEEITFQWKQGDLAAAASVDGDGLLGYALKHAGRFVPGEGPEELNNPDLPTDLIEYLRRFDG
ncbi:hypothetical protein [Tranquillimonas alkanivorans]|uniref:Uncharacterized protein n=1 Tax=Tranquillimonas alkanivorans TaxID=441119 RepID=A0A1I5W2C4_9RHOB|nr:hypothetical protein [Tranquillimonas alkanivorans]SFQ13879.1 hypothetical protein SAMN04488047_13910 [Tranquillimonas alkanivorans]